MGRATSGESDLGEHLEHKHLHDSYKSVYRRDHLIQSAFLKIHGDIAEALDEGSLAA